MSLRTKAAKAMTLLGNSRTRSALLKHRVAATTEHLDAIRFCAPATLVDVGANKGQFSTAVRSLFPKARIEAFEPLPVAADRYEKVFAGDTLAKLHRVAIGSERGSVPFYVADRADSSSLLKPGEGQEAAFGVGLQSVIEVPVAPLDEVVVLADLPRPILMKIDVQGAELQVLQGCHDLSGIDFIYVELSFVTLYEDQCLYDEVVDYLTARGFVLRGVFNQAFTPQFGPTQADFLFVRAGQP